MPSRVLQRQAWSCVTIADLRGCAKGNGKSTVAAEKEFGSEFPEEFGGELWRWCMQKGVHVYLKRKYYDLKLATSKRDLWIIMATGDAARVNQAGAIK